MILQFSSVSPSLYQGQVFSFYNAVLYKDVFCMPESVFGIQLTVFQILRFQCTGKNICPSFSDYENTGSENAS